MTKKVISLAFTVLQYAELKPVPCLTYSDAQVLREKCATPILKQVLLVFMTNGKRMSLPQLKQIVSEFAVGNLLYVSFRNLESMIKLLAC